MEGDVITASDICSVGHRTSGDNSAGELRPIRPTGIRPTFTQRLRDQGVELPAELFGGLADLPRPKVGSR